MFFENRGESRKCEARSRASLVMLNMHSMATLRHAEFEERGIQLYLETQSDGITGCARLAGCSESPRFARCGIAKREAANEAGAATEFLDFFRDELFVVDASFDKAVMEHRINVQRNCSKYRSNSHGDKQFQESKALESRRFNRQNSIHSQIRIPPSLTDNAPSV